MASLADLVMPVYDTAVMATNTPIMTMTIKSSIIVNPLDTRRASKFIFLA